MKRHSVPSCYFFPAALAFIGFVVCPLLKGQVKPGVAGAQTENSVGAPDAQAEAELRTGVDLTRRGLFAEAIPHFLTAKGRVSDEFVAEFNLALCYIGTAEFSRAIQVLDALRHKGRATSNVENLLAQAYIGSGQSE